MCWNLKRLAIVLILLIGAQVLVTAEDFVLSSPEFGDGADLPLACTTDGENRSPALTWTGVPAGTRSFVVICIDSQDADNVSVHWVLYNIPARRRSLPAGLARQVELEDGMRHGSNDFRDSAYPGIGWDGPLASAAYRRYTFRMYALDVVLKLPGLPDRAILRRIMDGHVLGQASLQGRYRSRP